MVKNLPVMQEIRVIPGLGRSRSLNLSCSRKGHSTPVPLPGKFHGQRSLVDYHGATKIQI